MTGPRCYSFFFYCSGHHRDLHSFPTRRSSDLAQCGAQGSVAALRIRRLRPQEPVSAGLVAPVEPGIDRKSTRLNSSHQIISYAVFCLKKKKQKISTTLHKPSRLNTTAMQQCTS